MGAARIARGRRVRSGRLQGRTFQCRLGRISTRANQIFSTTLPDFERAAELNRYRLNAAGRLLRRGACYLPRSSGIAF